MGITRYMKKSPRLGAQSSRNASLAVAHSGACDEADGAVKLRCLVVTQISWVGAAAVAWMYPFRDNIRVSPAGRADTLTLGLLSPTLSVQQIGIKGFGVLGEGRKWVEYTNSAIRDFSAKTCEAL